VGEEREKKGGRKGIGRRTEKKWAPEKRVEECERGREWERREGGRGGEGEGREGGGGGGKGERGELQIKRKL